MNNIRFLFIVFTCIFNVCFESASNASGAYGLSPEQEQIFVEAMQQYMCQLNETSRYIRLGNEFPVPPHDFFDHPLNGDVKNAWNWRVKRNVSVSRALDCILAPPAGEKHIVECTLATHLTYLQGIRTVIGNDELFNNICSTTMDKTKSRGCLDIIPNSFLKKLTDEDNCVGAGSWLYLEQLTDPNYFSCNTPFPLLIKAINIKCGEMPIYRIKHRASTFQGINIIMTNDRDCIYFEPGLREPKPLESVARMLVEDMNADLTPEFILLMKYVPEASNLFNSIKYKNPSEAHRTILQNADSMKIDFTKIFECATGLWEME